MNEIRLLAHSPGFDTAELIGGPFDGLFIHPAPEPEMIFLMFDPDTHADLTCRYVYRVNIDSGNFHLHCTIPWKTIIEGNYTDDVRKRYP